MDDEDFIELKPSGEGDEYEYRSSDEMPGKSISPLKAKIIFWSVVVGGIAVGTLVFLTFISLFIYFFVPIVIFASIWALIKYFQRR